MTSHPKSRNGQIAEGKVETQEALYSFLCNEEPVATVFRDSLKSDLSRAQLKRAFKVYYKIRSLIPIPVRQMLQKRRNSAIEIDHDWYLPTQFESKLAEALESQPRTIVHPWPKAAPFALVLTHDVETAEGMKLIEPLARVEEDLGLRSSWNVVPHKYPVALGVLNDLQDRGFEIGVHGYNHDGRLFQDEKTFLNRLPAMAVSMKAFGAQGFRAPMVHRNLDWISRLQPQYDASCFDVDPYQAMPGGIGSIWPCIVNANDAGEMVELPYTMPQDHTLFVSLGQQDDSVWRSKLEYLRKRSGMALMLTHPDYLNTDSLRSMYRDFLEYAIEQPHWHALPSEVATWWKQRAAQNPTSPRSICRPFALATLSQTDGNICVQENTNTSQNSELCAVRNEDA